MTWTKKGNFNALFSSSRGSKLNRHCNYENSTPLNIKELSLCGYSDGDYRISAEAPNETSYKRLAQQILRAGFPAPDFGDKALNAVTLVTSDPSLIASFLLAIKEVAPELSDIEQEVCQSLGIDLTSRAVVPTWHQLGNFAETALIPGVPLIRLVNYRTGAAESIINEFSLYGYNDRDCLFSMNFIGNDSLRLRQALTEARLPLTFSENGKMARLCFSPSSVGNLYRLLDIVSQHSPHFTEICDSFKQHVCPVITAPIAAMPRTAFFQGQSTGPAVQLPFVNTGTNDAKLTAVGFDNDIPDKYCCSLSLVIMTEPVYAKGFEQYQFEKSWILRHLATSNTHPFTRLPLTQSDLVPNNELKTEITAFVDNAIRERQEKDAPGNTAT